MSGLGLSRCCLVVVVELGQVSDVCATQDEACMAAGGAFHQALGTAVL